MEREIERLSGHYIICGAGRVGRSAARRLAQRSAPFVIIDQREDRITQLDPHWFTLTGDATKEALLRHARIETAAGLVAATTTDANNLYIVLTARTLNPRLKIIARAAEEDAEKHLLKAGADNVISPYTFAGHRIAQTFIQPTVLDFLDLATGHDAKLDLVIEEILIDPASSLVGRTLKEADLRGRMDVIVLAVKHQGAAGMRFNPTSAELLKGGDFLVAMGQPENMKKLELCAASQG